MTTSLGSTDAGPAGGGWVVSCDLTFDVREPADIALQIAVAHGPGNGSERFDLMVDGRAVGDRGELAVPHGGRVHLVRAQPGTLTVSYLAEVRRTPSPQQPRTPQTPGATSPPGGAGAADRNAPETVGAALDLERLLYLRPSRYCPSDHVVGLAVAEFGGLPPGRARADAVADWVYQRVGYVTGSSRVHDSAEDTLLTGQGVCRDFAHLGITLCRALRVPARFVAVYAPGLSPMDFHAVYEAWVDGAWHCYDATRRVPRPSLVRIATGRDAADTALASVLGGLAALDSIEVTATVAGLLPVDDHERAVQLG